MHGCHNTQYKWTRTSEKLSSDHNDYFTGMVHSMCAVMIGFSFEIICKSFVSTGASSCCDAGTQISIHIDLNTSFRFNSRVFLLTTIVNEIKSLYCLSSRARLLSFFLVARVGSESFYSDWSFFDATWIGIVVCLILRFISSLINTTRAIALSIPSNPSTI